MSSSYYFSRIKQKLAGLRTSLVPLADSRKQIEKLDLFCQAPFFFLFPPLSGCLSGRQEAAREKGEKWTCVYSPSFQWVCEFCFFFSSGHSPGERKKEWEIESEATKKKRKKKRCFLSKTWLLSLSLREAAVPWGSPGQLFMMPRCHLTVPSWGAISNSDINWPLTAFLPVWCHGGRMSHRSSLCVHAAVFTQSRIRLNNAPLNPCGRFCRKVTDRRCLA